MLSFADKVWFYALLLLPVIAALFLLARRSRRRRLERYGKAESLKGLMPDVSNWRRYAKLTLELLLVAVIVLMLARPRLGTRKITEKASGIEVVLAIDVSNSMDASSTGDQNDISRMQQAKFLLEKLIDRMEGNKVGLLVFAGNAYMQAPMTIDAQGAKMFLSQINTSMAPTQGTAIGAALRMGASMFTTDPEVGKAVIVITDGENQEDDAVAMAKTLKENGIQVNVVGVGDEKGTRIPAGNGRYMLDDNGEEVVTALNEEMAHDIAKAGGGLYVNGSDNGALDAIDDNLAKLADNSLGQYTFSRQNEYFPVLAAIAMLLLLALILLPMKRSERLEGRFRWLAPALAATLFLSGTTACGKSDKQTTRAEQLAAEHDSLTAAATKDERNHIAAGNAFYNDSDYVEAEVEYRKAIEANPASLTARYNLATTLIRQGYIHQDSTRLLQADSLLKAVITDANATDYKHYRLVKNHAFHNLGNLYYSTGQWKESIEFFKMALRYNPDDDEARYNLRMAQLKLPKDQQQPEQQQQQQNEQQQNEQQDQQQNGGGQGKSDKNNNKNEQQDKKDGQGGQDKQQQTKDQQQAARRHDKNTERERDERVLKNARLNPGGNKPKDEDQKDKKQEQKQDNQDNKGQNKDRNEQQPPQQPPQQQPDPTAASHDQLLKAVEQRERGTGEKVRARKAQAAQGERARTRNKW